MNDLVPKTSIRTFLLIENRLLREALGRLFSKRNDLVVVGQGGHFGDSNHQILDAPFDVLVIDSMDAGWRNRLIGPDSEANFTFRIVLIAMNSEEAQFLSAIRHGVTGYLLQDASASDVVAAVRAVHRGEAVCPPLLCAALFRFVSELDQDEPAKVPNGRPDLTLRQQQLMNLVAKGLTNKEIAARLNLSEYTVRNHIHRILKRVDAGSRSEAVQTMRAHGYEIRA